MAPPEAGGHLWADEVEAEDEARGVAPPETFHAPPEWRQSAAPGGGGGEGSDAHAVQLEDGSYAQRDDWHEGMDVARGDSRQRLDMGHGFLRHIVSVSSPCHICADEELHHR